MASDGELLERWGQGDDGAAEELLDRYFEPICRFFRNKLATDVEDLIQQTFAICLEKRNQLRRSQSFRAYLYAVARHELYAYYRRNAKALDAFNPLETSIRDVDPSPSSVVAHNNARRQVLIALKAIPLDLQVALELRFWEGLSGPELAEVLDIPEGTVRSRLRRGIAALRERLSALDSVPAAGESIADFDAWASRIRRSVGPTGGSS